MFWSQVFRGFDHQRRRVLQEFGARKTTKSWRGDVDVTNCYLLRLDPVLFLVSERSTRSSESPLLHLQIERQTDR